MLKNTIFIFSIINLMGFYFLKYYKPYKEIEGMCEVTHYTDFCIIINSNDDECLRLINDKEYCNNISGNIPCWSLKNNTGCYAYDNYDNFNEVKKHITNMFEVMVYNYITKLHYSICGLITIWVIVMTIKVLK